MTEIPQSTIEAALTAWHTPGVGVVGDAQREDAGMRRAIQAALDEGGLVLASERATPKSELRRRAVANAECPICFERVFVAPQDDALGEAAQAVLDAMAGPPLTGGLLGAYTRLRRELEGTE